MCVQENNCIQQIFKKDGGMGNFQTEGEKDCTRREFFREIPYNNIAIIAIQHSKIKFIHTFGDFSHNVEWNSLKSVWQISLYILA